MNYTNSYLGADRMTIPSSNVAAILDYLEATFPPPQWMDRNGWESYYNSAMPIYIDAIVNKKYKPYVPGQSSPNPLIQYMNSKVGIRLGYATSFMYALYTLAQQGQIETYVWNPAIYGTVEENKPVGWFEDKLKDIKDDIADAAKESFNTLVIAGAIVGIIYLLGKTAMTKGIKLPSRS